MRIFEQSRAWMVPGDLEAHELEAFRPLTADQIALYNECPGTSSAEESKEQIYHRAMISSIRSEMNKLSQLISIPYVVFLTDKAGTILELVCSSPGTRDEMDQAGLQPGVSFCRQRSGLNAVSLAMEKNCISVVRGTEHSDPAFRDWNCVCAPLDCDSFRHSHDDIFIDTSFT